MRFPPRENFWIRTIRPLPHDREYLRPIGRTFDLRMQSEPIIALQSLLKKRKAKDLFKDIEVVVVRSEHDAPS